MFVSLNRLMTVNNLTCQCVHAGADPAFLIGGGGGGGWCQDKKGIITL